MIQMTKNVLLRKITDTCALSLMTFSLILFLVLFSDPRKALYWLRYLHSSSVLKFTIFVVDMLIVKLSNIHTYFWCFSGHVVTMECVERLIKKDWIHPLTSQKLSEKDIIVMQRVQMFLEGFCSFWDVLSFSRVVLDTLRLTLTWRDCIIDQHFKHKYYSVYFMTY